MNKKRVKYLRVMVKHHPEVMRFKKNQHPKTKRVTFLSNWRQIKSLYNRWQKYKKQESLLHYLRRMV